MSGYKQVIIDGKDFTGDVLSDQAFSIEITRDAATGTVVYALTSDLSLTGEAYNYLRSRFVPSCFSCEEKISLIIVPNCCGISLKFELLAEGIVLDYMACSVTITGLQLSEAAKAFKYLESNVWWQDKDGNLIVEDFTFPEVVYFKEPNFWQRLTMIFRNFNNSRYHYYHVCPFLLNILEWNAQKAGLTFDSTSIFQAYPEYRRTSILYGENREGPNVRNNYSFIRENFPIETPLQLMDRLRPVFNADFRILGTALKFETLDYWEDNAFILADFQELIDNDQMIGETKVQVDATENAAYGRFEYSNETIDTGCNRMHYEFSDLIEWNPSGLNECLRGEFSNVVEFSPVHVIGDRAYWRLRSDENLSVMSRIANQNSNAKLYMTTGTCSFPKLLVMPSNWQAQAGFGNTPEMKYDSEGNRRTCWQLSFVENEEEGLYQRFHKRRDPAKKSAIELGDITYQPESFCETVQLVQKYGVEVAISTPWGKGIPTGVELDFGNQTVTLKEVVVNCFYG